MFAFFRWTMSYRKPVRPQLRLEHLEDRCVPSTLTVLNNSDTGASGDGSLRGEIAAAASGDTINFDPSLSGQTITLSQTLSITKSITISGLGASHLAVSGNDNVQVLNIASSITVSIAGITIKDGSAMNLGGGGIYNRGSLTVSDSTLSGNSAGHAGGIANYGALTVTNSMLSRNSAGIGGGIFNQGGSTLTISNCTFNNNTAIADGGGGIYVGGGTVSVSNSAFFDNSAINQYSNGSGGAISSTSPLTVSNSTFSRNSASYGGGIASLNGTLRSREIIIWSKCACVPSRSMQDQRNA